MGDLQRSFVLGILAVLALSAAYGGYMLLDNGFGLPTEWLDATWFDDWRWPAALLIALVAAPACVLFLLEAARVRSAPLLTLAYGGGIMAWILVQVVFVPFFFLQPVIFGLGVLLVFLSALRLRAADD